MKKSATIHCSLFTIHCFLSCFAGTSDIAWTDSGVTFEGTCAYASSKGALKAVPCPEGYPAARKALVDAKGRVIGYLTERREEGRLSLYAHQVGSGGPTPSLVGELTVDLAVTCDADAIPCRAKEPAGSRVVSFGTPLADSALNDAIFLRERDTLVQFASDGKISVTTEAPGRFRVRLAGSNDVEVAVSVTPDYFKGRNIPHYKAIDRRRAPHAPTGWMAWNIYFDQATAEDNLREARAAAKLLKPYGLEIWSIESWQGHSDELPVAQFHNLDLSCNEKQFPQGMKAVADEIRALGFKPGLWIVPWGTGDKAFYEAHKKWFVHDPKGNPVGFWPGNYILDITNDEVVEYVRKMIRTYAFDWGFEFFKIDGMGAGLGYPSLGLMRPELKANFAKPDLVDPVYRFTHMFREAMGEDRYFLACGAAPTAPGIEDCDATRIGGDIVSPNQPVDWAHVRHQAAMTLRRNYHNNIVAWNDPDTLMVDPKALSLEEARVTTTVVGLPGGVMFAGDKIAELPSERLALVRQNLPVAETRPMDLYPISELKDVWNLVVKTPYQTWNTVALFNWDDVEKNVGFGFAELGLDPTKEYAVYETWTETWQGFCKDRFSMRVPPHAVRLVTVHPRSDRPILLSSDRHITRGFEDVVDCRAEGTKVHLKVTCVAGHVTTVRILSPDGTVTPVEVSSSESGIVEKTVDLARHVGDFDVRGYGAKGDGVTKDTAAIQKAIDAAGAAKGGRVVLAGGTYLTGSVQLRDGVELHIAKDARLLASPDLADFPDRTDVRHVKTENLPRFRNACVIFADEAEDIAITGEGFIDGNGMHHIKEKDDPNWKGWKYERKYPIEKSLPRVVFFAGCRRVRLRDVTMTNQPAGWSYWIHDCDDVRISGLKIRADVRYPNNDGIHVNCSRDVDISDCDIESGDDSIVVRANSRSLAENRPCERVFVRSCRLRSWANGIRIGWVNDGVIRDCRFTDITMDDTNCGIGIVFPGVPKHPDYGREASLVENLEFANIAMDGIYAHPLLCTVSPSTNTLVKAVRDIRLRNVRSRGLQLPYVKGRADAPFERFAFEDCVFEKVSDAELPDWEHHGPAYWDRHREEKFEHAVGFTFDRCRFEGR